MKTYQDFLKKSGSEQDKQEFILEAINEHKQSGMYNLAADAEEYAHQRNSTIMKNKVRKESNYTPIFM